VDIQADYQKCKGLKTFVSLCLMLWHRDNNGPNNKSSTMGNGENIKYVSVNSIFALCGKEMLIRNNLLFRLAHMVLTVDIMDSLFNSYVFSCILNIQT
jgi:hypothetical protein